MFFFQMVFINKRGITIFPRFTQNLPFCINPKTPNSKMLSFDIQVEIIKKLPVRLLIQLRSVCKAWKSLIDSSHFIAVYHARHDQSRHLIVRQQVGYVVKRFSFIDDEDTSPQQKCALTKVPHLVQTTTTTILGSSHGLLCSAGFLGGTDPTTFIATLWNPAIRKSIAVVLPDARPGRMFNTIVGFGIRPDTKDPKLVKITYISDPKKMESINCIPNQVMVFTLSSGEWTCLCSDRQLPRKSIRFFNHGPQTVIGRFLYLVAYDCISFGDNFRPRYLMMLLSFDLITNEFREVHLPSSLAATYRGLSLSISSLRESLVVVRYDDYMVGPVPTDNWKQVCTVWMMMEEEGDSKAFTKLFTIDLPNASVYSFLGFRKNGEAVVIVGDDGPGFDKCSIVSYEPCTENIKELGIRGKMYSFEMCSLSGSFYTESLLLLDYDDGHIVQCGPVKTEVTFGTS